MPTPRKIKKNELGYRVTPSSSPKGRPIDDNIRNEIVRLRLAGFKYDEITRALHVSKATVVSVLNQSFN